MSEQFLFFLFLSFSMFRFFFLFRFFVFPSEKTGKRTLSFSMFRFFFSFSFFRSPFRENRKKKRKQEKELHTCAKQANVLSSNQLATSLEPASHQEQEILEPNQLPKSGLGRSPIYMHSFVVGSAKCIQGITLTEGEETPP